MLPTGIITLWFGSIGTIPAGWALCDGTSGTPDLRNRFVPGAGGLYSPGFSGGAFEHDHFFIGSGHNHDMQAGTGIASGANFSTATTVENASGVTDLGDSIPPFHALAFIMKL